MTGAIDFHMVTHQLTIVLIRCQHICIDSIGTCLSGECADDIVCLESIDLEDRYSIGLKQVFDDRNSLSDIFWSLLALSLVGRECLAAEGWSVGVEGHANMGGLFFCEHLVEGVEEAHDGTCVQPFRVDSEVFDERVIASIDERISV